MKNIILTLLIILASCAFCIAQENITIDELRTPSAPGFILLDEAPSSVDKPTTPQQFSASLLSLGKGGSIEFTPYWFGQNSNLTFDEFYKKKWTPLQTLSLSASTNNTDTLSYISVGARTIILNIRKQDVLDSIKSCKKQIQDALLVLDQKKLGDLRQKMDSLLSKTKPIFSIDIAAAMLGNGYKKNFDDIGLYKWGVWTTLQWSPDKIPFDFILVNRFSSTDTISYYDLGSRINYAKGTFSLGAEYVARWNIAQENYDYRLAGILEYKINDNLYATATFGKNFSDVNNLIALIGINIGVTKNNHLKLK